MGDFGLSVSPSFRDSALRHVSPKALQLWVLLASYAAHVSHTREIAGLPVTVEPGEVLIAMRTLKKDLGCGITQLLRSLDELTAAHAIERTTVQRPATFPKRERTRSQIETVQRSGNGNAVRCVLSRIKVHGLKVLPRNGHVPESRTQVLQATSSPYGRREQQERARFERQMAAEGR